jgi:SNF2 family DNA or RNA helicase
MLRRTKAEKQPDGRALLELPSKTVEIVELEFSPEVRRRRRIRIIPLIRARRKRSSMPALRLKASASSATC